VARLRYVRAELEVPTAPTAHGRGFETVTVGWLPSERWFCTCAARACEHVQQVRTVIEEGK